MPFPTTKKKIRNLADGVDISFYRPKAVLDKYGYKQYRLAEELGASLASINGIVNGNPSIAQVKLLADTIGCSFLEFFDATAGNSASVGISCPRCGLPMSVQANVTITPQSQIDSSNETTPSRFLTASSNAQQQANGNKSSKDVNISNDGANMLGEDVNESNKEGNANAK